MAMFLILFVSIIEVIQTLKAIENNDGFAAKRQPSNKKDQTIAVWSHRSTLLYLAGPVIFDHEIVLNFEHTWNSICQNIHQVGGSAIADIAF